MKYTGEYNDIINLPHHVSKKHPQMSLYARSSQFAPFAALTGYEEAVKETARETSERIDLDEELKNILDSKILLLSEKIKSKPEISFTYFVPDAKKNGGTYINVTGIVRKIDTYSQTIYLADNTEIPVGDIIDINGEIFEY